MQERESVKLITNLLQIRFHFLAVDLVNVVLELIFNLSLLGTKNLKMALRDVAGED
jgi:hypothetical protein